MHLLPFFGEASYLYLLQFAFMVWMLVDCARRRGEYYWFLVILFLPGFGAWIYFFVVKIHDFRVFDSARSFAFQRRPSTNELRYRVERSPTIVNHLAMAERLIEKGVPAEAMPHLESVLSREPEYCQALYLLAVCQLRTGHAAAAVPYLEKINTRDRRWSNYRAWHLLIDARLACEDREAALATARELVKQSATIEHQCMLANRLLDTGKASEAEHAIDRALEDQNFLPFSRRWRNRRWISEARRLQKRIDAESQQQAK
jgi:hypothetical protein